VQILTDTVPDFTQEQEKPWKLAISKVSNGALTFKSEHEPLFIFVRGIFGAIFIR